MYNIRELRKEEYIAAKQAAEGHDEGHHEEHAHH
jgi:hypothetical protein